MWSFARREPSSILLSAQLAALLLFPLMEGAVGRALFSVFGIALLALVVIAVRSTPGLTWVVILLGVPATLLLLIQASTDSDALFPYSSALEAVLYFYAAGAMIAYMLADHEITRDELFAVGATFTLGAWAFAYSYVVVQAIEPESFTAAIDPRADRTWMELLFLSFTSSVEHRPQRRGPGQGVRARGRDARAGGGRGLHRDGGLPPRGPDGAAARRAVASHWQRRTGGTPWSTSTPTARRAARPGERWRPAGRPAANGWWASPAS